jgi:hypothetical protein
MADPPNYRSDCDEISTEEIRTYFSRVDELECGSNTLRR